MVPVPESDGSTGRAVIAESAPAVEVVSREGALDDGRPAGADERQRLRRHQRQVEACRGVPLAGRKRSPVVRPAPLAVRKRAATPGDEGRKRHDALGEHAVEVGGARPGQVAAGQQLELASAHEAAARDRVAERAHIGERVARRDRGARCRRRRRRGSPRCRSRRRRRAASRALRCGSSEALEIVDAAMDGGRRIESERLGERGPDRPEPVEGGAKRRELLLPAKSRDEARPVKRARIPHVGMRAHRAHLGGGDAGKPPGPILRIVDVDGRGLRILSGSAAPARRSARRD